MKSIARIICLMTALVVAMSCVKEPQMTFEEVEQISLKAWIEKNRPDLLDNYQEEGGYYVEVLDEGCADSTSLVGKDAWVWYDFTARDLRGNVCETRSSDLATQLGTYTPHTHYVPLFRFSGVDNHTLMEGTYLAIFNKLNIDGEEFEVRYGTKLRLWLPSSVVAGESGSSGDGGYEGQYALSGNKPMCVDMTLYGHIANPVAYEGNHVNSFAEINGGLCDEHKSEVEDEAEKTNIRRRSVTRNGEDTGDEPLDTRPLEFYDGRWHQPIDTLAQLYVNYSYSPARQSFNYDAIGIDTMMYPNQTDYNKGKIYGTQSLADIDNRINQALVERFGEGLAQDAILEADSVVSKSTVSLWYICRMLDGFVVDTNIDEVKEIVYGEVESAGTALTFHTKDPMENNFVLSWNYAIPTLRIGQWASILTVSTYAYGMSGQTGVNNTTTTSNNNAYYDYMQYYNYMNYMNSYYGYGYGNMYNMGYYGYNPYYYGYNYDYSDMEDETITTTTTSTEIPSFTPLLFQIFIQ